jgi:hypothetical protein
VASLLLLVMDILPFIGDGQVVVSQYSFDIDWTNWILCEWFWALSSSW